MSDTPMRISPKLDPESRYALTEIIVDNHNIHSKSNFPIFDILTSEGQRIDIPADYPELICRVANTDKMKFTVIYELPDMFEAQVSYLISENEMDITTTVLSESGVKIIAIGNNICELTPDSVDKDFLGVVIPEFTGRLLTFKSTPCSYHHEIMQSAKYLANFFAISFKDTGLIVRPMHFSTAYYYGVDASVIKIGVKQHFRPELTENFLTPICHHSLTLKFALVTNQVQPQNWRDISIYYRQRFLPTNDTKHPWYRDALTGSFSLHGDIANFADHLSIASRLDYADLALWVVCAHCPKFVNLDHLYWDFIPDPTRGDYLKFKEAATIYNWKVNVHEDMDIVTVGRGWDERYVRRRPNGDLYQDGEWGGRKSYFRSFLGFRDNWKGFIDKVFDRWNVRNDDLWHDDVNGWFWWEDYNIDHPSTRHMDLEVRREIWKYCRDVRGVHMSDECLMEGMTDLNDFSHWTFCYEAAVNDRIMMMPLMFLGGSYYGYACAEAIPARDLRLPPINFAYSLLVGVKFETSIGSHDISLIMESYFKNNLMWSFIADAFVETFDQCGDDYSISYSNGVRLNVNPAINDFTMSIEGIDYHRYTPVNKKGFMALWNSGTYPLADGNACPFRTHLWQSHEEIELAGVTTTIDMNGFTRISAATTTSPMPEDVRRYMRAKQGNDNVEYIETPDILVLQRIPAAIKATKTVELTEIASVENEMRFVMHSEPETAIDVKMLSQGWGVRLYTDECGEALWDTSLHLLSADAAIISFHPYIYGVRDDSNY